MNQHQAQMYQYNVPAWNMNRDEVRKLGAHVEYTLRNIAFRHDRRDCVWLVHADARVLGWHDFGCTKQKASLFECPPAVRAQLLFYLTNRVPMRLRDYLRQITNAPPGPRYLGELLQLKRHRNADELAASSASTVTSGACITLNYNAIVTSTF